MKILFLVPAVIGAVLSAHAIAADVQKSTMEGGCATWGLSAGDLKSCNEQMARAKTEADRMDVQKRFQIGSNTSGVDPAAITRSTGDTPAGVLPDQKKDAPGSGTQGAADKKGTPERTP